MIGTNLALRFLLELVGVAALAFVGAQAVDGAWRWVAAVAAPAAMIALWARVAAPKARNGLAPATRQLLGSAILLVVAATLAVSGAPAVAVVYGAAIVVNTALLRRLGATDVLRATGDAPEMAGAR